MGKESFKENVKLYVYDAIEDTSNLDFDFVEVVDTPESVLAKIVGWNRIEIRIGKAST